MVSDIEFNNLIINFGTQKTWNIPVVLPHAHKDVKYVLVVSAVDSTAGNWCTPYTRTSTQFTLVFAQAATYTLPVCYITVGL